MWGPVSESAPKFPIHNGSNPHGSVMAFKIQPDGDSYKPSLQPAWISADFNLPDPVVIANGVVFALSTGENAQLAVSDGQVYAVDHDSQVYCFGLKAKTPSP